MLGENYANQMLDTTRGIYSGSASKAELMKIRQNRSNDEALKVASKEFASVFIGQMYKIMRESVQTGDMFNGGEAEKTFQQMLDGEYARTAAYNDKLGISDMIYKSLSQRNAAAAYGTQTPADASAAGVEDNG